MEDLRQPELSDAARRVEVDPAAREQFAATQRFDASIGRAVREVEAPEGLADRILARLQSPVDVPGAIDLPPEETTAAPAAGETSAATAAPRSRRWMLWSTSAAIVAAAASVAIVLWWPETPSLGTPSEVASRAIDFHVADVDHADGKSLPAPAAYPAGSAAVTNAASRWRHVEDFFGRPAVAYDLVDRSGPNHVTATLYVVEVAVDHAWPTLPAENFGASTQGKSAWAWRSDDAQRMYVLVIDGSPDDFERFIRQRAGPIA
jgi:hypothetical protein